LAGITIGENIGGVDGSIRRKGLEQVCLSSLETKVSDKELHGCFPLDSNGVVGLLWNRTEKRRYGKGGQTHSPTAE
jgi:hypothetical protein